MAGEKTERATPKRKRDERKKGNIFLSREVIIVSSLIVTFYALRLLGPVFISAIGHSITEMLDYSAQVDLLAVSDLRQLFIKSATVFLVTAMPMLLVAGLTTVLVTVFQTQGLFATQSLAFKGDRLNPLEGIKKMFSLRSLVELFKSLSKIIVLGYIIYKKLEDEIGKMPRLMDMSVEQGIYYTAGVVFSVVKSVAVIMAFLAAADYLYQWWQYEKGLMMSKEEIKEEYKQTEGDPKIKGKIRERQQQQARQRMMQNVPHADVVIRNPTHFAVALKYDPKVDLAPMVIAKGMDSLALRIVKMAEEHDVVVTENVPLARGLYETVDIGQFIPDNFYQPVAEVLAFVYKLKKDFEL